MNTAWAGLLVATWTTVASTRPSTVSQESFESPEAAVSALAQAARAGDEERLRRILGPSGQGLINSGDPVADRRSRADLVAEFDRSHELLRQRDVVVLIIGEREWPFPLAILERGGAWRFETTKLGAEQAVGRRIEKNELATVHAMHAYVAAQREYGNHRQEYARKVISSAGAHDGLYWPTEPGQPESPLGALVAHALSLGYETHPSGHTATPYFGYRYRILDAQGSDAPGGARSYIVNGRMTGGFALIASPASYGKSGRHTFIVGPQGAIYQRDLGAGTPSKATAITRFDPGPGWTPVRSQTPLPQG